MKVYLVDVGVLLPKDHKEFEAYSTVYDHEWGYYDENQFYVSNLEDAIEEARNYVEAGVEGTYGIVLETEIDDDCVEWSGGGSYLENPVDCEDYQLSDVVFNARKANGEVEQDFLQMEPEKSM